MIMRTAAPLGARRCSAPRVARSSVPRSGPVRALAFSGPTDKTERLTSVANEFVYAWSRGTHASGPSKQALAAITNIVTPDVRVKAVHPLGNVEFSGLSGVQKKLMLDATFKSSMRPSRVMLSAADEDTGCVFLLLECEEMGSMDDDVNIVLLELNCIGRTYGIIKLQIDPASLQVEGAPARISAVTERMQLGPADACLLTMLYPDHKLNEMMEAEELKEKDHAGKVALRMASAWHFPHERISAKPLEGVAITAARNAMQTWCDARSSGSDVEGLLKSVTAPNFALWDPYGVLPTVCGVRANDGKCTYKGIQADTIANCVMPLESVINRLQVLQSTYDIRCKQLDSAVCSSHNVGFTHWRSELRRVVYSNDGASVFVDPEPYTIEAMAVHVFTPEGAIKDTWMLRDPNEAEKDLMTSVCSIDGGGTKEATPSSSDEGVVVDMAEC